MFRLRGLIIPRRNKSRFFQDYYFLFVCEMAPLDLKRSVEERNTFQTNRLCSIPNLLTIYHKRHVPFGTNLELHEARNEVGFYFELTVCAW